MAVAEPKLLWTPSQERIERATLTRYQRWLAETRGLEFEGYHELWRWSVSDLEGFWGSLVEFCGVRFAEGGERVLGTESMPGASWFPGSRVSWAEHMFAGKADDALAIQHASESRALERLTWGELRSQTASIAAGLRALGVSEGDRVAAYMPNIPETVAALLACASIGAVWSSAAPEFGARSVIAPRRSSRRCCWRSTATNTGANRSTGVRPSTGSPLSPEGFQWIYDELGSDTWLFSTSGGTDLCTAFVGGVPTLPVYLGELQARSLGASVESWDPEGRSLIGEVGELVITRPMPSMPVFFWGDEDGSRYRDSYFSMYPGIWRHDDWIEITSRETAVIYGRSDSTINRGGIRMGTSEIYRAVLALDEVVDALVVDVPRPGSDGWMPLFVVLREGASLDETLVSQIRKRIREDCSPRHVPDQITQIAEVPRTLSGKVLEVPVKRILMGTPPEQAASRESLANPDALDFFIQLSGEKQGTRGS